MLQMLTQLMQLLEKRFIALKAEIEKLDINKLIYLPTI